jgi:hypothetical protein
VSNIILFYTLQLNNLLMKFKLVQDDIPVFINNFKCLKVLIDCFYHAILNFNERIIREILIEASINVGFF